MHIVRLIFILMISTCVIDCYADTSTKKERNLIKEGNAKYNENNFSEAEVYYKKALEQNSLSDIANFNKASTLMKQSGNTPADSPNNPIVEADSIFNTLVQSTTNEEVKEWSYYNMGNIAFDKRDYAKSINMYKNALRINPDNDNARENLRLAQLKLKEQQNNQDKNKDNKQDKQDKQDKQNQDKQNDKNKDNNQNKDQQNQKDQQDKNQQQQPSQSEQQKEKKPQNAQGISDANAEKILKTMENEENATRRKINLRKAKEAEQNAARRQTNNQW